MTIHISENFPKLIRDFFLYDNSESDGTAHAPIDFPFDLDRSALLKDAQRLPWDTSYQINRCTIIHDKADDGGTVRTIPKGTQIEPAIDLSKYPAIDRLIKKLEEIGPVTYMSFKNMLPGEYLLPHIDSHHAPLIVYCPITWPEGNYFKIYKHGLVDFSDLKPNIVANGDQVHSVVNDSQQERITFSFYPDWQSPGWNKILSGTKI